ncbi:beta-N-acetylhexosaminidase [Lentzea sp. BCCO 10_0061]|uniref:beta-N-acetylhexosaminidase n=1 Tax=Lentzea sokolovensis TaxID=3095429 RepID=A0ABU4UVU4_9PSEU|nr:beta-N-acetylhexosaminidase [Lentzea sp. BCCO 10_0061]MDX8143594.1 beta-N-acetylhexosaminidase [Lentzea sp. BCCO 10_0061]
MNLLPRPVSYVDGGRLCEYQGWQTVLVDGPPGGYRLLSSDAGVLIEANDAAGEMNALQTLRQLLGAQAFRAAGEKPAFIPACEIVDHPRFAWRGVMLDVSRHFLPKREVLRYVELLSVHKLNVLHLHLTDDQGWRFEVKRYPKLTEVGAWREDSRFGDRRSAGMKGRPHGGFYTQEDLREIVEYARQRFITVIPEIDIPGHSQAAIAAYPELGVHGGGVWTDWGVNERVLNTEESTVDFYRNVFDELMDVFPAEIIGLGGDEAPGHDGELVRAIAKHIVRNGRRPYGWDEILESGPLPAGTVVASWRGVEGGITALGEGHDVVMCPEQHVYLDYRQSESPDEPIPVGTVTTLEDVYAWDPVPEGLTGAEPGRLLGAQANIWTEHLDSARRVDYAAFPRLAAFAEVVWSPAEKDPEFVQRLREHHLPRLDALGVEYRPLTGPHPWQRLPGVPGFPR